MGSKRKFLIPVYVGILGNQKKIRFADLLCAINSWCYVVACACNAEDAIAAANSKCGERDESAKAKVFHPTQKVVQSVVQEYGGKS